jgi:Holliday junction resolvase RusA-like endonuclease
MIRFTVHGKPQGKARPRFAKGRTYTPAKTVAYEREIAEAARAAWVGRDLIEGPVYIIVNAFFPIPASWPKRKRSEAAAGALWHIGKPDWDNIGKAVSDALNGVIWADDSQVAFAKVTKHYGTAPRLEVFIERLL